MIAHKVLALQLFKAINDHPRRSNFSKCIQKCNARISASAVCCKDRLGLWVLSNYVDKQYVPNQFLLQRVWEHLMAAHALMLP